MTSSLNNKRQLFTFHGGVHPEDNKEQTNTKGIAQAPIPEELVIPLQQHIGAPAKPLVQVGDRVLKGQKIAEAHGFVSVPKHASSSGEVIAIEDRPVQHPSGLNGNCIVIKTDGKDEWLELQALKNFREAEKEDLLEHIRDGGIAGMGGAGFPSAVKLNIQEHHNIETLILNSVECEPYITADDVLIQESAPEILEGLLILNHILGAKEILVAIEDNMTAAIEAYQNALKKNEFSNIELVIVPTVYPSGGEKQLIQILTGKEVPENGLPADLGIVCQNTGTVLAIYERVMHGKPLVSRVTTLTGNALDNQQNYRALIGTPFKHLLIEAGIHWDKLEKLVMGGPMMGFTVHDSEVPVVKTTNCILASATGELITENDERPCIRCGSCSEVCPANLLPQQLYWYSKAKELDMTSEYNLSDCIECGACSFVCPSNIPLVQYFRFAKGETRKKETELKKSEISRARFEAHKERLEREKAEKEAARKAKAKAREQKAKQKPQEDTEKLEIAFHLAKTNAAKAAKQFKEAEKALEHARKNDADNIDELEQSVASLKEKSESAQTAFKKALDEKKAGATNNGGSENKNPLELKISEAREISAQANEHLKELKKALLSAKTGSGDTSSLEKSVSEAKEKSDQAKARLRELLQEQKQSLNNQNQQEN